MRKEMFARLLTVIYLESGGTTRENNINATKRAIGFQLSRHLSHYQNRYPV